jgi:predicted pyridoxine 5'-phosphate oxidase superfamily flavin-nucleotide-binding protein
MKTGQHDERNEQRPRKVSTSSVHAEKTAHREFGVEKLWQKHDVSNMLLTELTIAMQDFITALPFFFIATANDIGECDCSYRGRETVDDLISPLLHITSPGCIVFPDFSGNNVYNSLGNILTNGQIGILFIDFEHQLRLRVNGRASIIQEREAYADIWPTALRYIKVDITQVFGNCRRRIPRMYIADSEPVNTPESGTEQEQP